METIKQVCHIGVLSIAPRVDLPKLNSKIASRTDAFLQVQNVFNSRRKH